MLLIKQGLGNGKGMGTKPNFNPNIQVAMRFTAETRWYLKWKISIRLT